jgi:acyl-CoA hydrolase
VTTSIRVDDSTKRKINRIQAKILLETGIRITQQQIVSLLADWGTENMEAFRRILADNPVQLDNDEIKAYEKHRVSTGVRTSPEEADRILYGD